MHDTRPIASQNLKSRSWIRLRTLVLLRWWAIGGQLAALAVAQYLLNLEIETALCYSVVGLSIITNIMAIIVFPKNKRLSEREIFFIVFFDLIQLSALLYLTGGLNNPFSLLIVGPVTVSAAALNTRLTLILGATAVLNTSLLTQFFLPLRTMSGAILEVSDLLLVGNWVATVIAVIFLGVYSRWIASEIGSMSEALQATQMALAREQKLTDLGGVVAAAAHELGTPLATIKLTSSELASELVDQPDLADDALLIRDQADRCRDILRSMGRMGKDDLHMHQAPLTAVVEEAAEPHSDRGKDLTFYTASDTEGPQPTIARKPEIIHGLRNLIQNAVDFSRSQVWIESGWTSETVTVRIIDDGRGFPTHLLGQIGEPFMRNRSQQSHAFRPEYEGMGLGLFIAKTLLERSGADLSFTNGSWSFRNLPEHTDKSGAVVEVSWPRKRLEALRNRESSPLGVNAPIRA
ncbi:MAG: ActS/PrrB/RegB family redox-sensitive histidine kinase [Pseudomonadota bacterium]